MEAGYWGRREEEGMPQGVGRGVWTLEMAVVKSLGERAVSNAMGVGGAGFEGCGAVVGVRVDGVVFWGYGASWEGWRGIAAVRVGGIVLWGYGVVL